MFKKIFFKLFFIRFDEKPQIFYIIFIKKTLKNMIQN